MRSEANPILTAADVPYPANSIFNPGAARVGDESGLDLGAQRPARDDDEVGEAGPRGVEGGIVHERGAIGPQRVELLGATVAAAETGSEEDEGRGRHGPRERGVW